MWLCMHVTSPACRVPPPGLACPPPPACMPIFSDTFICYMHGNTEAQCCAWQQGCVCSRDMDQTENQALNHEALP